MNGGDRTNTATKSSRPSPQFAGLQMLRVVAVRPRGPGEHAVQYVTRIDPQSTPHKSTHPRAARVSASGTPTPNDTHHIAHTRHTPPCCLQTHERADTRQRHRASHSILRGPRRLRAASWSHPTPQAQLNTVHGPRASTMTYDGMPAPPRGALSACAHAIHSRHATPRTPPVANALSGG